MTKPYIFYSNRSALIETGKHSIYYGEDEIDPISGDYCLVVRRGEKEIARYTNSQLLEMANGEGMKDLVIAGLVIMLR